MYEKLGNPAIVCAKRPDILLQTYDRYVSVHVGEGTDRVSMHAKWEEDNVDNTGFNRKRKCGTSENFV